MALAADFSGLHAWAQAMGTILLLELIVLLLIIAALAFMLAFGARWLQMHVVPVLNNTVPVAKQALEVTNQSTDRVVRGVAEVYGVQSALETMARIIVFGKHGTRVAPRETPIAPETGVVVPASTREPTPPRATRAAGAVAPAERRQPPPPTEPRQTGQPYDNFTAHAS